MGEEDIVSNPIPAPGSGRPGEEGGAGEEDESSSSPSVFFLTTPCKRFLGTRAPEGGGLPGGGDGEDGAYIQQNTDDKIIKMTK